MYGLYSMPQGSFFRLQNTEGLTLVGLFMEGTTLTCLETYSDAKKRTLACPTTFDSETVLRQVQLQHYCCSTSRVLYCLMVAYCTATILRPYCFNRVEIPDALR
jgi:hypothetical protein